MTVTGIGSIVSSAPALQNMQNQLDAPGRQSGAGQKAADAEPAGRDPVTMIRFRLATQVAVMTDGLGERQPA
jgi:hypothetical protein